MQGRYKMALSRFREALRMRQEIGDRFGILVSLYNIGVIRMETGRLPGATDTLEHAVRLADDLRLNATSPEARRSLLSKQIKAYRALITAHVHSGRPDSALRAIEQARARLLADRLAGTATGDTSFATPSVNELRQTLGPEEAALLYANAGSKWPLTALVVTEDTTVARELPDSTVRAAVEREYPSRLDRLRRTEGPLSAARTGPSTEEGPSLAEIVRLYRYYLTREQASSIQRDLARRLHGLLVEPVTGALADKSELITVPTGALGYLPFETLRDSSGQYLIEDTHVRYAQSLTVLRQLRGREYSERTRPLLAMGGAAYRAEEAGEPDGNVLAEARRGSTRVRTRGHASTLLRDAERRLEQGKSPRTTYERLGYGAWPPLPATEGEVRRLGRIAGTRARVVTGRGASESLIRSMSADGRLRQYRRVHFATHGIAVPETPALSALVLSQVGASDSLAARDGYLTMEEIADLKMKADVAVLSACQTGLGKVVAGEGVVSLSHAFLRAGANATLVSQWKVLDESTRRFMAAVYRRAEKRTTSFAEAVTETKRAFIAGEHGAKNTDPLRWAPFVYYGRE
jgi:CHAT domain-containing protein